MSLRISFVPCRSGFAAVLLLTHTAAVTALLPVPSAATQDAAASPLLEGVALPKGATPLRGLDAPFASWLTKLSKEKLVGREAVSGAKPVVLAWRGEDFKENRVRFNKSALRRALADAGYEVKEVREDRLRDVNQFEHFDRDDRSLPLQAVPGIQRPDYFYAERPGHGGQALVGAWLMDETGLAVGLLPVLYRAAAAAKPLPPPDAGPNAIIVADLNNAAKGAPALAPPAFPKVTPKPRTVRGIVKDGAGRPIAGARIAVYSSAGGGFRTTHKAVSDAQGTYEVPLPVGVGEVAEGTAQVAYNGKTFELPLRPVGTGAGSTFNTAKGYVQNFVLGTSGEFGGTIRLTDNVTEGTIEVTMKPDGLLLDGSAGRPLVFRFDTGESHSETYLNGIPLGRYTLTARLLDDGEALPLQAGRMFGTDTERALGLKLRVEFAPGYTFSQANPGKSNKGVAYFEAVLEP
jgi:hypothetical protein